MSMLRVCAELVYTVNNYTKENDMKCTQISRIKNDSTVSLALIVESD